MVSNFVFFNLKCQMRHETATDMLKRIAFIISEAIKLPNMRFAWGIVVMRCSGMMGWAARDSTQRNAGNATAKTAMETTTIG